jgi:hypothetical protein
MQKLLHPANGLKYIAKDKCSKDGVGKRTEGGEPDLRGQARP